MDSAFDMAFAWLLVDEGSVFTSDPIDRGGATKFGVTQQALAEWLGRPVGPSDVAALTMEQARQFYYDQFWVPLRCGAILRPRKAIALFDLAVLVGRRSGVVMAQTAAHAEPDGDLGPLTLAAINTTEDVTFIASLAGLAAHRFVRIALSDPPQVRFLQGWIARAMRLLELLTP